MIYFEIYKMPNVRNRFKIKKTDRCLFVSKGTSPLVSGAFFFFVRKEILRGN